MKQFKRLRIGQQFVGVYFIAVFLPAVALGSFLLYNILTGQQTHYSELLKSNNAGVSQTLYEITTQIYTISDSIVYNDELIEFLNGEYETSLDMIRQASKITLLDKYVKKYAGIEEIRIYIDRPDIVDYGQFKRVTDDIRESDWYQKAIEQYVPFWMATKTETAFGGFDIWNLTLFRKMVLVGGEREAVIMIRIRDSYLGSRIENSKYITSISVDDQVVAFSNTSSLYGSRPAIPIDYEDTAYSYEATVDYEGKESLVCLSTLNLSKSANKLYLVSYDTDALSSIRKMLKTSYLVLTLALVLPLAFILLFSKQFAGQVMTLRNEMGKASRGEYREMTDELVGSAELSDAFKDLQKMVFDIQRMEAEQYEATIKSQKIENEQQKIEYRMLSNQINPHFLYNTLEMIRMKALTAGDRPVANAIMLLGKSMRYVLENSGTSDTTLKKEYDHILNYLQIQKLRFGDRVNYAINIQPGIELENYTMLPLLLQPIVENSIVHGLEKRENDGHIGIAISIEDGYGEKINKLVLVIRISDNGCGMSSEQVEKIRESWETYKAKIPVNSIGLYNINRRIKLAYGEEYGLFITSREGLGTTVSVVIPPILENKKV